MVKFNFLLLFFSFSINILKAQCLSGDCQNGYGKMRYNNGIYEGMFLNGKNHGHGIYDWDKGDRYVGAFLNNTRTGKGIYYFDLNTLEDPFSEKNDIQGYYEGDFIDGQMTGWGKRQSNNGSYYEGSFMNGKMNGSGTYYFKGGAIYTGSIEEGFFHGYGIMKYTDGFVYMGQFSNGKKNGEGVLINNKTGEQTFGKWKDDVKVQ